MFPTKNYSKTSNFNGFFLSLKFNLEKMKIFKYFLYFDISPTKYDSEIDFFSNLKI
jgi:hypothetical protein